MKITKLQHACLILEHDGHRLVIDPGNFTEPLDDIADVTAVVFTHTHDDHCWPAQLDRILRANPSARLTGPASVAEKLRGYPVQSVYPGDSVRVPGFDLTFGGGTHALIHSSIPRIENVSVQVGGLYYPGDSFAVPDVEPTVLAVPSSAPWLKVAEVIDFVHAVRPRIVFPTHNAYWSDIGNRVVNARIQEATEQVGGRFVSLEPGQSLDVSA